MSLCPYFCECKPCKHGYTPCMDVACPECTRIRELNARQREHDESVRRQRAKIRRLNMEGM